MPKPPVNLAPRPYKPGPGSDIINNAELKALAPAGLAPSKYRIRRMRGYVFEPPSSPFPAAGMLSRPLLRQWYDRILAVVRPRQVAKMLATRALGGGDVAAASAYMRHFGKNGTAGPAPQQARKKGGLDAELEAFQARGGDGAGGAGADAQVSVVAGQGEPVEAAVKQSTGGEGGNEASPIQKVPKFSTENSPKPIPEEER